jgi:drug/metabolite transporter (DMT)-like permease
MSDDTSPTAAPAGSHAAVGIALIATGVLLFSIYNALGKWLAADFSPLQIMFFRGLFGFLPFAAWALLHDGARVLRSTQPGMQVLRGGLGFSANLLFIYAYREMPLADTVAIGYAAPIFIVALSWPLLGEHVGVRRASAAVIGFLGVLLITRPGSSLFSVGIVYALGGTLCYALLIITTRRLGRSDNALCTVVYSSGIYALACAATLPGVWVTPARADLGYLVATGLLGGTGMLLFAQAYRHAAAAVLAPFDYTAMLWALLFGYLVWGDLPGPVAFAGMLIIAGSGLFLMHHERMQRFRPDKP